MTIGGKTVLCCLMLFPESTNGQRDCCKIVYHFSWEYLLSLYEKPSAAVLQTYPLREAM